MQGLPLIALGAMAAIWLGFSLRFPQLAIGVLLLWIPVQGWFQLNVFNDSSATVLLYEYLTIGIYLAFGVRALKAPERFGPPKVVWLALPFIVWVLLLVPRSVSLNPLMTLLGLRTYLLPLPLVWIGYRAFERRRQLENVAWLTMVQMVIVTAVAAAQFAQFDAPSGAYLDVPLGFGYSSVVRPPGTFSAAGYLGMYILLVVLLAVGLLGLRVSVGRRTGFVIGLASAVVALFINTQRATVLLLVMTLPMVILSVRRRHAIRVAAMAALVLAVGWQIGNQLAGTAFFLRMQTIAFDARTSVVTVPLERVRDALRTPGIGDALGIAAPGVRRLVAPNFGRLALESQSPKPSESFIAALIYQTGVPGLVMYAFFIGVLIRQGLRSLKACRHTDMAMLAAAIVGFEMAIVMHSWAYDPLHFLPTRILFWFWAGVLLRLPVLAGADASAPVRSRATAIPQRRLARLTAPAGQTRVGLPFPDRLPLEPGARRGRLGR